MTVTVLGKSPERKAWVDDGVYRGYRFGEGEGEGEGAKVFWLHTDRGVLELPYYYASKQIEIGEQVTIDAKNILKSIEKRYSQ